MRRTQPEYPLGDWVSAEAACKRIAELEARLRPEEARAKKAEDSEEMSSGCFIMSSEDLAHFDPTADPKSVPPMFLNDWLRKVVGVHRRRIADLEAQLAAEKARADALSARCSELEIDLNLRNAGTTHSDECWRWHQDCARRKVEGLQGEADRFHVSYRLKCDEETKRLHVQVADLESQLAAERKGREHFQAVLEAALKDQDYGEGG